MRIKRGTLSADREGGRLYVLLTEEPTDRTSELINFHGEDHFTYEVCDNGKPEERCATAGVYVTIHPVNDSPIAREDRSEEHTSELQSRQYLVCRLLLEKKKNL